MGKRIYPDADAARRALNERRRKARNATDETRQAYNAYQAAWRHAHPERWEEIRRRHYQKNKNKES